MEFLVCKFLLIFGFLWFYLTSVTLVASFGSTDRSIFPTCDDFGTCSQKCDMVAGQAKCSCVDMFHLNNDNKTCQLNDPETQLIYSTRDAIYCLRQNTDDFTDPPQQTQILNIAEGLFGHVTNDVRNNYLYVARFFEGHRGVFRINVSHPELEIVADVGIYMSYGIAFDWITGNVYFVDNKYNYIAICAPHLNQCAKIVDEVGNGTNGEIRLTDIALDPNAGIMFWAAYGSVIKKADMDGSNLMTIVSTGLYFPHGITVDEASSRIYWTDSTNNLIETARYDGSGRHKIASSNFPVEIGVFGDKVYWTDWSDGDINVVNKYGGNKSQILALAMPRGLTVMHISQQPILRTNPCENLQCSHICALSSSTAKCVCPVGMIRNASACLDDEKSPKLLLAIGNVLLITPINAVGRDVFKQVQLPPQIKAIKALVYNPINKSLIICDDVSKNIVEYKMGSQEFLILAQTDIINVTCLEIDTVGENLFWYDAGKMTLEVMSLKTRARAILIENFQDIHDIFFVRDLGALYISQLTITGMQDIRKIALSQSQIVNYALIHKFWNNVEPVQLTYDNEKNDVLGVFWNSSCVYVQTINSGIKYTYNSNYSVLDAVQISNKMFWVDTTDKVKVHTTFSVPVNIIQTINFVIPVSNIAPNVSSKVLAAMETISDPLELLRSNHQCSPVNPFRKACSHICLPTENSNVGVCWCPSHLQLGLDGLACIDKENDAKANGADLGEDNYKIGNQSISNTDAFSVVNTTRKPSAAGGFSRSSSATVYLIVPICLIITMIIVAVIIYLIMKLKENGTPLVPQPFSPYNEM